MALIEMVSPRAGRTFLAGTVGAATECGLMWLRSAYNNYASELFTEAVDHFKAAQAIYASGAEIPSLYIFDPKKHNLPS